MQVSILLVFALQASATITSGQKPGAFNENFDANDVFIDLCNPFEPTKTLEDGKAVIVYTSGPLSSQTSM